MSDSAHWDERYRTTEFIWKTEPNRFLPPEVAGLTPGQALDLACGEGRNAVARSGVAARALAPGGTLLIVGHDLLNLTEGVGGPQSATVLYTPDDVREDLRVSGVADLVVDRAERVHRPVDTDSGPAAAIDCLVRAHRP